MQATKTVTANVCRGCGTTEMVVWFHPIAERYYCEACARKVNDRFPGSMVFHPDTIHVMGEDLRVGMCYVEFASMFEIENIQYDTQWTSKDGLHRWHVKSKWVGGYPVNPVNLKFSSALREDLPWNVIT